MPRHLKLIATAMLVFAPGAAYADAGLPMLALAWPLQWFAFVPIVLIECELLSKSLQLPYKRLFLPTCKANLISTLVGVPVAWLVMMSIGVAVYFGLSQLPPSMAPPDSGFVSYLLLPLTAAWVTGNSAWQIYSAFVILTVPFCWASIYLEEPIVRKTFPDVAPALIRTATIRANIWSYVLLSAVALVFPLTR